jgi:hypothetical protein
MKHPIDPRDVPLLQALLDPFIDKSRGPKNCWPWTGASNGRYGTVYFKGHNYGSHVLAYLADRKKIRQELLVLHNCDNSICCNPAHLFQGTHGRNAKDRERRNRGCYGTRNHLGKYPIQMVEEARRRYWAGESPTALTSEYKLSRNLIYLWASNRIRAHGI